MFKENPYHLATLTLKNWFGKIFTLQAFSSAIHAVWSLWSCIHHAFKDNLRKISLKEYFNAILHYFGVNLLSGLTAAISSLLGLRFSWEPNAMQIPTDLLTSLSRKIIIRSLFYLLADLVLASHANVLRGVVFPPFHKLLLTQVQHSFPIVYPHGNVTNQQWGVLFYKFPRIAYFTVPCENEAGVDLLLIQPFLLYYVNHVVLSLTIFQA